MPADVKVDTLTTPYADGMLEISALVGEQGSAAKVIPITVGKTKLKQS
jgi:hypothetical protein